MDRKHESADKFVIALYGKEGCAKCKSLLGRVSAILKQDRYQVFSLRYFDLSTRAGLVAMALGETVNGQRLPTLQIMRKTAEGLEKIRDPRREESRKDRLFVPVYLQLETDYSDPARSVIKPAEVEELMNIALSC